MAHRAAEQLLEVPPQSWGLSELSDAIVAGTCAFGTLGALWHVISALLALMTLPRADGPGSLRRGGASALAARLLEAWGAPAVRRITASALLVSLSSAPALAAEGTAGGDDLGWHPTSSAPASPPSQSSTPSPQADQPAPEATAGTGASQSRSESSTASAEQAPSTGSSASDRSSQSAEPPSPSSSRAQSSAGPAPQTSSTPTYTVVPGESLWSITARLLPAGSGPEQIAQAWPVLYRANSDVVGADPSLIRPGTVLSVPDSLSAPSTTTGGQAPSR
nr:LysM domain-containing protein [Actinomyces sp. oral taxon 171]